MKLSSKEVEVINILRNLSHENIERIYNIFNALTMYSLMNYTENEPIVIPGFGSFLIKYKGDEVTNKGKEAKLEIIFIPSDFLKENIGFYEDFKNGKLNNITDIPIIKQLENEQIQALRSILNDTWENSFDD
ncbi:MAG TPA: hypothetical protein PLN85_02635 [archaeon]|nr:hypothetical protein [archaeon]